MAEDVSATVIRSAALEGATGHLRVFVQLAWGACVAGLHGSDQEFPNIGRPAMTTLLQAAAPSPGLARVAQQLRQIALCTGRLRCGVVCACSHGSHWIAFFLPLTFY